MDKLIRKLRGSIIFSVLVIILSISWLVLDYYILGKVIAGTDILTNFEVAILKISIAVFGLLIFTFLINIYYALRVSSKSKSELNKVKREIEQTTAVEEISAINK